MKNMNEFPGMDVGTDTQELTEAQAFAHLQMVRAQIHSMGNVDFEEAFIADLEQKLQQQTITPLEAIETVNRMLESRIER